MEFAAEWADKFDEAPLNVEVDVLKLRAEGEVSGLKLGWMDSRPPMMDCASSSVRTPARCRARAHATEPVTS